jgi:hypothetical protein
MAAFMPAQRSPMGNPERTGRPPISPVSDMPPPSAWTIMSNAGRSRYGPSRPKPVSEVTTRFGLTARSTSAPMESFSIVPGRKFSITASADPTSASSASRPASVLRLMQTLSLLRLTLR